MTHWDKQSVCTVSLLCYSTPAGSAPQKNLLSRAIDLFLNQGKQSWVCLCHRFLGTYIDQPARREEPSSIPSIPSTSTTQFDWARSACFLIRECPGMAVFSTKEGLMMLESHIEHAKSHTIDNEYFLVARRGTGLLVE